MNSPQQILTTTIRILMPDPGTCLGCLGLSDLKLAATIFTLENARRWLDGEELGSRGVAHWRMWHDDNPEHEFSKGEFARKLRLEE